MARSIENRSGARAFTLVQLLVLIGIIALLIGILLPTMQRLRYRDGSTRCASNLRQIGQAILLYSNDNRGAYPRTTYVAGPQVIPTWGTGAASSNPFALDGPAPNDVTAALYLLIRTQDIRLETFVCPSTDQSAWDFGGGQNTALNWSNFSDVKRQLSYSFQNRYHSEAVDAAMRTRFKLSDYIHAEYAIAADLNPGCAPGTVNVMTVTTTSSARDMKLANSLNHAGEGQNVLYDDGHVSFEQNPFVGIQRDNIFTTKLASTGFSGGPIVAPPFDESDSILLPTSQ
jgi:type II secretory pathway pseudopilin PulG